MAIALKPHQQQMVDFIISRPHCGVWLDMGGGKTLSTLAALMQLRPVGHILVVAPVAIARSIWVEEIEKWQMPIRTRSLIVDDNDRQLSKDERLARFAEIATDSPSMYFINQEMLTQSSQSTRVLVAAPDAAGSVPVSSEAQAVLDLGRALGPLKQDELVSAVIAAAVDRGEKPAAKARVTAWIKELVKASRLVRETVKCRSCSSEGCRQCRFGLVDQMLFDEAEPTWPFRTVIIDESQGFKSHSSRRFQALKAIRPTVERFIELTGTPAANGLEGLWSQMYLLDGGEALGRNISTFRDRWFTPKMVPGTNTPAKWIPNPGAEAEIHRAIGHLVMSAENTELNLPGRTVEDVTVSLALDLMEDYKSFKRELVLDIVDDNLLQAAREAFDQWLATPTPEAQVVRAELSGLTGDDHEDVYQGHLKRFLDANRMSLVTTVVAQNEAVLSSKLLQFAGGTLYTSDPDDPSTKGRYEVVHTAKAEMAEYLIRNNGGSPVLLAYHFRSDKEQLLTRLKGAGIGAEEFDGSRRMVRRWNAGQVEVMLVHPASAGHGLNLQEGGHILIWYTVPFSLEHYLQTNKRLDRPGQARSVTIYRLLTKGTHDERMPGVLGEKKDTQDSLLKAVSIQRRDDLKLAALSDELADDIRALTPA